jgi:hypothetical protein
MEMMKLDPCAFEKEVMAAVQSGQWPTACGPALQAHVENCRHCAELVAVSRTLQAIRSDAVAQAKLAAPGLLFWKAQLRRRNEALKQITRPVLAAEIVGIGVTLVALGLILLKWIFEKGNPAQEASGTVINWVTSGGSWGWFLAAATTLTVVLFAGVALYLVTAKE